jgi:hypothetical protein
VSETFVALLRSYLDEPLHLGPDNPGPDESGNTVWFSVPSTPIDQQAVETALIDVGRQLRARFRDARPPATFYAWYDQQAGQLRFALGSVSSDALPFGGRHHVVHEPGPVVALLVADEHPGVVLWDELSPADPELGAAEPPPFPVFAVPIAAGVP